MDMTLAKGRQSCDLIGLFGNYVLLNRRTRETTGIGDNSLNRATVMRFLTVTVIVLLIAGASCAQVPGSQNSIDADIAFAKWQGTLSAALVHDWHLGRNGKFVIGISGRATAYLGRNQYYVTAPAELTSGDTGPFVIFKENIESNMDTFLIANPLVFAINAGINIGYRFNERFSLGFNIDAIGFSVGSEKNGNYINGTQGAITGAKPTPFNVLLISDNDRGSLNSQLYAKQKINETWSARAGLQFLFTEYTTNSEVQQFPEPNDRFRRKSLMVMIGTSIKI
jgi:hypothetical protein